MSFYNSYSSRRGGYAPRRGRGGSARFTKREPVKPDLIKHPFGDLVSTLHSHDLDRTTASVAGTASITNCQYVASYNWTDEKSPTIIVPGKPPMWTPPKQCPYLKEDSGEFFRDPNAARYPTYPTEPAVRALLESNPGFPTQEVDLFACGGTMGSLLRFARGIDKSFRFSVEKIGKTIFFVRKENDPRELIEGVYGYGHTFPEAYTTWESDVKGSNSHQRMVQYSIGGLNCVIRFESDGYLADAKPPGKNNDLVQPKAAQKPTVDDLLDTFGATAIQGGIVFGADELNIRAGGSVVSQRSIFDLKTRSGRYKKEIHMTDIYPLLWIKQIPNFIIAYHDGSGNFKDIRVQDVQSDVQKWEKDNQRTIQRLVVLLNKIVGEAKQDDVGLLEVYSPGSNRLEIRKQYAGGSHALPQELIAGWKFKEGSSATPDEVFGSADNGYAVWGEGYGSHYESDSDDAGKDFTACSADSCGYCGRCSY